MIKRIFFVLILICPVLLSGCIATKHQKKTMILKDLKTIYEQDFVIVKDVGNDEFIVSPENNRTLKAEASIWWGSDGEGPVPSFKWNVDCNYGEILLTNLVKDCKLDTKFNFDEWAECVSFEVKSYKDIPKAISDAKKFYEFLNNNKIKIVKSRSNTVAGDIDVSFEYAGNKGLNIRYCALTNGDSLEDFYRSKEDFVPEIRDAYIETAKEALSNLKDIPEQEIKRTVNNTIYILKFKDKIYSTAMDDPTNSFNIYDTCVENNTVYYKGDALIRLLRANSYHIKDFEYGKATKIDTLEIRNSGVKIKIGKDIIKMNTFGSEPFYTKNGKKIYFKSKKSGYVSAEDIHELLGLKVSYDEMRGIFAIG